MNAAALSSLLKHTQSVPSRPAITVPTKSASLPPIVIVTRSVAADSAPGWESRTLLVVAPAHAENEKLAVPCCAARSAGYARDERSQLADRS
jgi:hypothetical protein